MYDFIKINKISIFCRLKMSNISISMFSYVEIPFFIFLKLFEALLTSYDAAQRKKWPQFMYDFKQMIKISVFYYLKMTNIWISMFSYVENMFFEDTEIVWIVFYVIRCYKM